MPAPIFILLGKMLLPMVVREAVGKVATAVTRPKKESAMDMILGLVRHVLTAAGGVFVAKGYVDSGTLEAVIGALLTLFGAAWSIYDKKAKKEGE